MFDSCDSTHYDSLQPIKPEIDFRVQPSYYELAPKLWEAINQGVNVGHSEWAAAAVISLLLL